MVEIRGLDQARSFPRIAGIAFFRNALKTVARGPNGGRIACLADRSNASI